MSDQNVETEEEYVVPKTAAELVLKLDEREQNPDDFMRMHGATALVNLLNELSEEICDSGGRVNKGVDEYVSGWYWKASRVIKGHYSPRY